MFRTKNHCIREYNHEHSLFACLLMMCKLHKIELTRKEVVDHVNGRKLSGARFIRIINKLGLNAKEIVSADSRLPKNIPSPFIAGLKSGNSTYYAVITRIKKNKIFIADPVNGFQKKAIRDFEKEWDHSFFVITKAETLSLKAQVKSVLGYFAGFAKNQKAILVQIFFASLLITVFSITNAFFFKFLIDDIFPGALKSTLSIVSIGMLLILIFRLLLEASRKHLLLYFSQKMHIILLEELYSHIYKLPLSYFDKNKTGDILTRLNDIASIRSAISGAAVSALIDTFMIVVGGIVLFLQSWQLFLIAVVIIPLYALLASSFRKPFRDKNRLIAARNSDTRSYLVESLNGIATIKSMNAENEVIWETEKGFIKILKSVFSLNMVSNLYVVLEELLILGGGIFILWYGGNQVLDGAMSIGQLITFNALLVNFHAPIRNFVNLLPSIQEASVALERVRAILDVDVEFKDDEGTVVLSKINGSIRIKNLSFAYDKENNVLEGINLKINPKEKIAIVGESGGGKSTLIKLLLKYYPAENGTVTVDNINIKDINTQKYRSLIGYVPQDTFLYSGTILDNILFGRKKIPYQQILKASKIANAHEFISKMPKRYKTSVGEKGATLSGGQKQRIALARAILENPDVLILDEATSNLDSVAENTIHNAITKHFNDKTLIIIAHRLSTIKRCDRIIVIDKGKIVEQGTHKSLLAKRGHYYNLWKHQLIPARKEEV